KMRLSARSARQRCRPLRGLINDLFSPRSGRKHKAWGASPRIEAIKTRLSARSARQRCRPLRGLARLLINDPGACAPGFMLSLASRALLTRFASFAYALREL